MSGFLDCDGSPGGFSYYANDPTGLAQSKAAARAERARERVEEENRKRRLANQLVEYVSHFGEDYCRRNYANHELINAYSDPLPPWAASFKETKR